MLLSMNGIAQIKISGKIYSAADNSILTGANIQLINSYKITSSNLKGYFEMSGLKKSDHIHISFIGYENDTLSVKLFGDSTKSIYLKPRSYQTDEVVITASRADKDMSSTSIIGKDDIMKRNLGKDMPYLLKQTPSVISSSDGGNGMGYTSLRIRGSDEKAINVTMNGIPINDAESHTVIWANMPDIASSMQSIQIQRGVGTSSNGSASFGGSINLETTTLNEEGYAEVNNSYGSFNSRKHTVKVGSGLINNHFTFEGRLSQLNTDGYIDRAKAKLQSYYTSGSYYGEKTVVKALVFGGKENTYQSWYGTPESRFKNNLEEMIEHANRSGYSPTQTANLLNSGRSYNYYLYGNQIDNYQQHHYQLHFTHEFSKSFTANLSFHYTKGEGFFEEFQTDDNLAFYNLDSIFIGNDTISNSDLVRRRWLDNDFYGFVFSTIYQVNNKLNFNLGGGLNNYEGHHFGEIIWAKYASNSLATDRYYYNKGDKLDGNIYLKTNYQLSDKIKLFADLQLRNIYYKIHGIDNDQRPLDINETFLFFNPKVGANWKIDNHNSTYVFMGIANREPNRADFKDYPINAPPTDASKSERLNNLEIGYEHRKNKYFIATNYFLMDYRNQLVNTGHLNDVGVPVRQNVDKSYRMGVEIQAAYQPIDKLQLSAQASWSINKIKGFSEKIYNYDSNLEETILHGETDISFSPKAIAGGEISYEILKDLQLSFISQYVDAQYLDNTSNKDRMLDAYFTNDIHISYQLPSKLIKAASIHLAINNVFSEDYASNGYTYSYIAGQTITENFVYPQAFRNYMMSLNLRF